MGNRSNHSRVNSVNNPKNKDNREGFWTNLVKDDNNFSTVNFFLVAATIVGIPRGAFLPTVRKIFLKELKAIWKYESKAHNAFKF